MPSLIDMRRRIRAVKSTQQITKAMKMVAASKLRRAQERVQATRPFAGQARHARQQDAVDRAGVERVELRKCRPVLPLRRLDEPHEVVFRCGGLRPRAPPYALTRGAP